MKIITNTKAKRAYLLTRIGLLVNDMGMKGYALEVELKVATGKGNLAELDNDQLDGFLTHLGKQHQALVPSAYTDTALEKLIG